MTHRRWASCYITWFLLTLILVFYSVNVVCSHLGLNDTGKVPNGSHRVVILD